MVIAYTVWFLAPSQPIAAFLQRPETRRLLAGKPVITLIGCRNMWLAAQEKMKTLLAANGAQLVGNIVKTDACGTAASFVTTPAWLLTGNKRYFRSLPAAGIAENELADGARFGEKLRDALLAGAPLDETLFQNMGAARVDEKLIFSEKAASRSFYLWGRLLAVYIVFLITLILTVIPISIVLKKLLHPLLKRRLAQAKHHYAQPSGE